MFSKFQKASLLAACLAVSLFPVAAGGQPPVGQPPATDPVPNATPVNPMDAGPLPATARFGLTAPKTEWVLGENIVLTFQLVNDGLQPFVYSVGGDYRGTGRAERFKVTATDAEGNVVADPIFAAGAMFGGGLGGRYELGPNQMVEYSIPLLRYCRFEKPGTYTVRISHDFGWTPDAKRPQPIATMTLTLNAPTPEQAQKVVEDAIKNPVDGPNGKTPDFTLLRAPEYLPLLNGRAQKGDVSAVEGIGQIPTPEATRALIELSSSANHKVAAAACRAINARLPSVDRDIKAPDGSSNPVRVYFHTRSWQPKFRVIILTRASVLVTAPDANLVREGAEMIERLGSWEDLTQVVRALDREMRRFTDAYPEPNVPRFALYRAARQLYKRGAGPPSQLRDKFPGEGAGYLLWAQEKGWGNLSADQRARVAPLLRHGLATMRILALETLPDRFPSASFQGSARTDAESRDATLKTARAALPNLLKDKSLAVRIAALYAAPKVQDWNIRPQVQNILASSKNEWERGAASNALMGMNGRYMALSVWADRIGQTGVPPYEPLSALGCLVANQGVGFDGNQAKGVNWQEVKGRWKKFLADHRKDIEAGRVWGWDETGGPRELFPACFTLTPPANPTPLPGGN